MFEKARQLYAYRSPTNFEWRVLHAFRVFGANWTFTFDCLLQAVSERVQAEPKDQADLRHCWSSASVLGLDAARHKLCHLDLSVGLESRNDEDLFSHRSGFVSFSQTFLARRFSKYNSIYCVKLTSPIFSIKIVSIKGRRILGLCKKITARIICDCI